MIMAALHTVNHNILSPTRYQLLRQIKSGSEGQDDVAQMLGILNEVEQRPVALGRVLDLGCASGRMLRFLPREETSEHWGLDINAAHIEWCQQNLNPPMLFATNTTSPHLPFEDNLFDLLYCGSVFTHISELAEAWLLEVRRVLRPGGYAYITIHTRQTIDLLRTKYRDNPLFADFLAEIDSALVNHDPAGREWSVFCGGGARSPSRGGDAEASCLAGCHSLVSRSCWHTLQRPAGSMDAERIMALIRSTSLTRD
jgi:SAM-dependent methyltransferase